MWKRIHLLGLYDKKWSLHVETYDCMIKIHLRQSVHCMWKRMVAKLTILQYYFTVVFKIRIWKFVWLNTV